MFRHILTYVNILNSIYRNHLMRLTLVIFRISRNPLYLTSKLPKKLNNIAITSSSRLSKWMNTQYEQKNNCCWTVLRCVESHNSICGWASNEVCNIKNVTCSSFSIGIFQKNWNKRNEHFYSIDHINCVRYVLKFSWSLRKINSKHVYTWWMGRMATFKHSFFLINSLYW